MENKEATNTNEIPDDAAILLIKADIKNKNVTFGLEIVAFADEQESPNPAPDRCRAHVKIYDPETNEVVSYDQGWLKGLQNPSRPIVMSLQAGGVEREGLENIDTIVLYKNSNGKINGAIFPLGESIMLAEAAARSASQAEINQIQQRRKKRGIKLQGAIDEKITRITLAETIYKTANMREMAQTLKSENLDFDEG